MKDNKLIAEFMGVDQVDIDYAINEHGQLKYHSSWDWLMPVVEKIYSLDADIDFFRVVNLEATYKSVVEFIKEYNDER